MSRLGLPSMALVGVVLLALPAAAQIPNIQDPIKKAQNAANATNANIAAQTGQEVRVVGKPQTGKPSGPASQKAAAAQAPAAGSAAATTPRGADAMPEVTREVFTYTDEGRRDPFYSLILTEELRPLLSDLKLVGILYAGPSGKSVAIMRDLQTNAQYRVNTGMTLGRMRVTQIKPRAVIFTLDEFGLNRQDSLFLADTSKTRIR